jgi:hypothetical protein
MALDSTSTLTAIVVVVIIACIIVIYAMRRRGEKPEKPSRQAAVEPALAGLPFKISKSVQTTDATQAKDELRILELEREILSDAIRRLYEAHAEGKITEQERERLAGSYKSRMMIIKDSMAKDETIVALHELEGMQEDLMKLFSERFGELNVKVEELRTKIDIKPIKEIPVKMPAATPEEEQADEEEEEEEEGEEGKPKQKRKKRQPSEKPSQKSEAEKRIDEMRNEVEKVLDKLGQMEIEG